MADRSIFYRRKTPQGAWTRAVGTRPFTISGLVGGEVYEVDDGTGVIQEAAALIAQANVAPTIEATAVLTGRTLTITIETLTGYPEPTVGLALTFGGVDVSADAVISGNTITWTAPSDQPEKTASWSLTATNTEGSDTATGSVTIPTDQTSTYSPEDYSSPDGLVVTSITPSGDDWLMSVTDGVDTVEATFTTAQMEGSDPLLVREAIITESPAGTYNAAPFWIIHRSDVTVEVTEVWEASGLPAASGDTYTPVGVDGIGGIDYVVSLSTGQVYTVVVQPEPAVTVNPIKAAGGNGKILYNNAMPTYPDQNFVLTGSYTVPSDLSAFAYPFGFNKTNGDPGGGINGFFSTNGEFVFTPNLNDGTAVSAGPRSGTDTRGKTFCFVLMVATDGTMTFASRDSAGGARNSTHTIPEDKFLAAQGNFSMGISGGGTLQTTQNYVAFWDRATDPARTAIELLRDLYDTDTCLPRAAVIGEYSLGQPILGLRGDADTVNSDGGWEGSFAGTATPQNGGFVDA